MKILFALLLFPAALMAQKRDTVYIHDTIYIPGPTIVYDTPFQMEPYRYEDNMPVITLWDTVVFKPKAIKPKKKPARKCNASQ